MYYAFDILQKDVLYSASNSKWNKWLVIDNILSETIWHVCSYASFSIFYRMINFHDKMGLTYAISVENWIF